MSLPRLRLEKCNFADGQWVISPEEAHHLVNVRRCYTGSLVEGLLEGEKLQLRLRCEGGVVTASEVSRETELPPYPEIHLLLALLKSDQFDASLRFAAEIGVTRIHLLECERSVPKYSAERAKDKMTRWRKILDEATKQAGSTRAPQLTAPMPLERLDLASLPGSKYAALLSDAAMPLGRLGIGYPAAVAIGPEGDWTPAEADLLLREGFIAVSLGERVLRASTAVAAACSWLALNAARGSGEA